jgi:mono/diheme cytochrome c family protein
MGDMDLTVAKRAARNPDGVVFYKVMNGRRKPKMPAFKEELTQEQVWAVVAYAQSLRKTK